MSMPRLRWWRRGRRRPAAAPRPYRPAPEPESAYRPAAQPEPGRRPAADLNGTRPAFSEVPGPELTVPDLAAETAPAWRPRSVIGTRPPAASYPQSPPLAAPTRPDPENADAGEDEPISATMPIPVRDAERPPAGWIP
jgi:hypothetical protein